jgi:hypothetical protein
MIRFWGLFTVCVGWSLKLTQSQPLEIEQHNALMSVYNDLGLMTLSHFISRFKIDFSFSYMQDATRQCAHDLLRRRIVLAWVWVVLLAVSHTCEFSRAMCMSMSV